MSSDTDIELIKYINECESKATQKLIYSSVSSGYKYEQIWRPCDVRSPRKGGGQTDTQMDKQTRSTTDRQTDVSVLKHRLFHRENRRLCKRDLVAKCD